LYTEFSAQGCVIFNHHILRSNVIPFSACVIKNCVNRTAYVSDLVVSFNLCMSTPPEVLLDEKLPTSSVLTCVSQDPCRDLSLIMVEVVVYKCICLGHISSIIAFIILVLCCNYAFWEVIKFE
jgi:hypothetical protein